MSLLQEGYIGGNDHSSSKHTDRRVPPILEELLQEGTRLGPLLLDIKNRKFGDYLTDIVKVKETDVDMVLADRTIVLESMRHQLGDQFPSHVVEQIIDQQSHYPLMQTADHSQLIYDPSTFLNNFIYHSAIQKAGLDYAVVQQCSTVRMLSTTKPKIGPGVVTLNDHLYRVFDTSNRKLKSSSVATLRDAKFILKPMDLDGDKEELPIVLNELRNQQYPDAAIAFREANYRIWDVIDSKDKRNLILFDEYLSSEIIARMILTPNHILNNLLFDSEASTVFRNVIRDFINSRNSLALTDTTDYFWGRTGDQLSAMRLSEQGDVIRTVQSSKELQIDFTPESIAYNLMAKNIYPNLILSMMAISILPQNTAVGGSSQYEYVPEIQEILRRTLLQLDIVPENYINTITEGNLTTMISHLLSRQHPIFSELPKLDYGDDILRFSNELQDATLAELMGDYSGFSYFSKLVARRETKQQSA